MNKQNTTTIILTILMFIGFFIALSPHATHIAADHSVYHSHAKEIAIGLAIGTSSLAVLIHNNRALKFWYKR